MNKFFGLAAVAALLAGCADREKTPVDRTNTVVDVVVGSDDESDITTPITIENGVITVGALGSATYDGSELRVQIALDGPDDPQVYTLVNEVRADDYKKFMLQISELNRAYTAIAGRTADGKLVAVVAMDGGQFNRFFGGGTLIQTAYTKPDGGMLSYAGNYAGLLNFGGETLPVTTDIPGAFPPSGAGEVVGKVFFTADFVGNKIEGGMEERVATLTLDDSSTIEVQLNDLVFIHSDVNQDGTFAGTVEFTVEDGEDAVGSYSGAFGGTNAEYLGGIVALGDGFWRGATNLTPVTVPVFDNTNQAEIDAAIATNDAYDVLIAGVANGYEQEFGIFVIDACGPLATDCSPAPP